MRDEGRGLTCPRSSLIPHPSSLPRLMLVTDAIGIEQDRGTAWIAAAVRGGVGIIQLRDRAASADELLSRARALRRVFPNVCLLVNSQIEAAAASGADGVQLGEGSPP